MYVSPLTCFRLYLSIKTHLTTLSYDAKAHGGRIKNATTEVLESRNDHLRFVHLSKLADSVPEMATLLIANFAYGNEYPLEDFELAKRNHQRWIKHKQSLTYRYTTDLQNISNYCTEKQIPFDYEFMSNPNHMIRLHKSRLISIQTLAIISTFEQASFRCLLKDSVLAFWKKDILLAYKLASFIKFDAEKFETMYRKTKEELECYHEKV